MTTFAPFVILANILCAANVPRASQFIEAYQAGFGPIAVDSASNIYVTGTTSSGGITATPGAFQTQDLDYNNTCGYAPMVGAPIPCQGSFIEKLDPTGKVLFATYFSGSGSTIISGIAVDAARNIYIAGTEGSPTGVAYTFPVTTGAAFTNLQGAGFIAKLNSSGSQLLYSTLLPDAAIGALAIDAQGNAYVTGSASTLPGSSQFPVTPGAFQSTPKSSNNDNPGFVAKLNAAGSALVYSTYLSGSGGAPGTGGDVPESIAVDANGNAFIAGYTRSPDFPVTPGAYMTTNPGSTVAYVGAPTALFLTKLNPQGSALVYSTYLTQGDTLAVKLDAQGDAFVAGGGLVAHVNTDGSSLVYTNPVAGVVYPGDLDVDPSGNAVIAATVTTGALPTGVGAFQPAFGGSTDAYVARYTPQGQLSGSTYLGGSLEEQANAIALAPNGSVFISGNTTSPDFPGLGQLVPQPGSAGLNFVVNVFPSLTAINAASYAATPMAPGEIVSLLGYGIGPATGLTAGGPTLPTQLGSVQVLFNGIAAPLFYAQSQQINAQVPWELAGETSVNIQISSPGVSTAEVPVAMQPAAPGVFYIVNSDGSFNSPSNPASPGDFISIYGTGGGAMSPPGSDGAFWPLMPLSSLTQSASVTIGGETARALYAGSAPTLESGFFQLNVQLPSDLTPAAQSLSITIGGLTSASASIAIQ